MIYKDKIFTAYEEKIKGIKSDYNNSSTYSLLGSYASAQYCLMEHLLGRKFTKSKSASQVRINPERIIFSAIEHADALHQLLKEKSGAEIYSLHQSLKNELHLPMSEAEREDIQFRIYLIENEIY